MSQPVSTSHAVFATSKLFKMHNLTRKPIGFKKAYNSWQILFSLLNIKVLSCPILQNCHLQKNHPLVSLFGLLFLHIFPIAQHQWILIQPASSLNNHCYFLGLGNKLQNNTTGYRKRYPGTRVPWRPRNTIFSFGKDFANSMVWCKAWLGSKAGTMPSFLPSRVTVVGTVGTVCWGEVPTLPTDIYIYTPETNISPLQIDGWKMKCPFKIGPFSMWHVNFPGGGTMKTKRL